MTAQPLHRSGRHARGWFTTRPRGVLRYALRLPIYLYRLHLGWLFNHLLLLTHRGRRSGRRRQTVLEIVHYDPVTRESVVAAAWGNPPEWYRNLQASPALEIQIGRERYRPLQRVLGPAEEAAVLRDYVQRQPWALPILARLVGVPGGDSETVFKAFVTAIPMVAFRPEQVTQERDQILLGSLGSLIGFG